MILYLIYKTDFVLTEVSFFISVREPNGTEIIIAKMKNKHLCRK